MIIDDSSVPLSRKLITTIIKKGAKVTETISSTVKEQGITLQQFNVLRILRGRKGNAASLQDVSKDMIHANSNTTRVIDKLVDKKYVDRIQCPNDRRQIELTITKKGLDVLAILDDKVNNAEAEITKGLNEESMTSLINELEKI
ncbi:DNA-binding MarR family transcriptional regulator [Nonlabens xylanidelens]|uniref:DNA-binding MarR family transcriptional regulator n=1 Tax=Nonlabens xylanidelens TaxID=191564 RepID=A0A2S6IDZ0_9FLAO|nr:MarR family transcriptional regulator [Nonlabens xylanidelens]PPK92380.1 DNA-binding MarR family transcriptional regulator [Nonlabens xylanidelens]PQJ19750.1 MarR family transcriptional regulator [Nonlabens xylanidelens]